MFKHSERQVRIIKILGAYGIVQILAQDLGIKTGKNKEILFKNYQYKLHYYMQAHI